MGLADPQPACRTSAFFVVVTGFSHAETDYRDFDSSAAKKFVLDPHGLLKKAAYFQKINSSSTSQ